MSVINSAQKNNFDGSMVFVTGADGFIGSHLVERLALMNVNVRALVNYNSWNSIGWLSDLPPHLLSKIEIVWGDVRDGNLMHQYIDGSNYVFHLASLIAIPYSYVAAKSYIDTNVNGTLNILEACKANKSLERIIHTSTSEVYGTAQTIPIPETHPLVGQSPYSASKIGADKMVESFALSFEVPAVTARPFNTFGPRQTARAVIPTIASQLLSRVSQLKLGFLSPTRDFNYVQDTVSGMLALAVGENVIGKTFNIGTGEEWSIKETVDILMNLTDCYPEIICEADRLRPNASEVNRLVADNKEISSLTGWSPRFSFESGLQQTVEWIEENLNHFNPSSFGY